jgi:transcriptional antiterminator RfaH
MSWIVARTEPSREQTARRFLELAGFSVYIPVIRERHAKGGRRLVRLRPLFPSYAFIVLQNGRWWDVRWSVGVAAVIMTGDEPAQLSDQIVDEIRSRERNGAVELPKCNGFKPGDLVRVTVGPLQGQVGVLGALRPHERVLVLMSWLGRVELSKHAVELVPK